MHDERITLTVMTDEMYRVFFRAYESDPDLCMPGQALVPYVYSEEKVARYVQRQRALKRVTLAVLRGDEIVGEIILKNIEAHKSATMGITLKNARYKDQGIGTAAERLAVRYAFYTLDLPTVYADTLLANTRSQRVLEKVGFRFLREDGDFKYYRIDRESDLR